MQENEPIRSDNKLSKSNSKILFFKTTGLEKFVPSFVMLCLGENFANVMFEFVLYNSWEKLFYSRYTVHA